MQHLFAGIEGIFAGESRRRSSCKKVERHARVSAVAGNFWPLLFCQLGPLTPAALPASSMALTTTPRTANPSRSMLFA
jgi:hypothetical protein